MARKEAKLNCCAITQALDTRYWNWDDDELKAIKDCDIAAIANIIKTKLESIGCVIAEMYIIHHDKDVHEVWSETEMKMVVEFKTNHVHVVIKFAVGMGTELSKIADAVGLAPQYIEKAGKGKYGYDNLLSYLIHIKYKDKHQYNYSEVMTIVGEPYATVYHNRKLDWEKGAAKIKATKTKADIDWLEQKILTGEVKRQQIMLTDDYFAIYAANKRRCDDAFGAYGERKAYRSLEMLKSGLYKLTVIFIKGKSGQGKTTIAKDIIHTTIRNAKERLHEDWEVYNGATSNVLDDFNGEEIIFLDDLRGNSMTASDWLRLLDPYNASPASARYRNKPVVASRVVVMTSTQDPHLYFYYTKNRGDVTEALDQFIRRVSACVKVYDIDANGQQNFSIAMSDNIPPEEKVFPDTTNMKLSTVTMHYGFPNEQVMSRDDAIEAAVELIMHNHSGKAMEETMKMYAERMQNA